MWKSLGTTMLGLAVGFGAAMLNAFQMPIVYSSGTLDAQRDNNRLTGETNRLLKDMSRSIANLGGSTQAAFG